MYGVHHPRRMRIVHDPRIDIVHEVLNPTSPFDRVSDSAWSSTACGIRIKRDRSYLADDESANCFLCLAHESFSR